MNEVIYLFAGNEKSSEDFLEHVSWVIQDENREHKFHKGMLKDVTDVSVNKSLTVVIPGELVSFFTVSVPGSNREKILQAIPYSLEENLVADVDTLHFAIAKNSESVTGLNSYQVVVTEKDLLSRLLEILKQHNLYPDRIVPDFMLWNSETRVLCHDNRVIVNSKDMKMSSSAASYAVLKNKLGELENEVAEGVFELALLQKDEPGNIVNLLQGNFKKEKSWSGVAKTWVPVAALFIIWIAVEAIFFGLDYFRLNTQNKQLQVTINNIYKNTFPEAKRIVDARAQMKQKLDELRRRKGHNGRGFSEMLTGSAAILSQKSGLEIKSLRYYDGRINIELKLASLQELDRLKQELVTKKGYRVEIQNAASEKDHVNARIQILGAES